MDKNLYCIVVHSPHTKILYGQKDFLIECLDLFEDGPLRRELCLGDGKGEEDEPGELNSYGYG